MQILWVVYVHFIHTSIFWAKNNTIPFFIKKFWCFHALLIIAQELVELLDPLYLYLYHMSFVRMLYILYYPNRAPRHPTSSLKLIIYLFYIWRWAYMAKTKFQPYKSSRMNEICRVLLHKGLGVLISHLCKIHRACLAW